MRTRVASLLLLLLTACSPAQRAASGIGVGVAGAAVTYGSASWMGPVCRQRSEPARTCVDYSEPLPPRIGFPLAFVGMGAMVVGGALVASSSITGKVPRAHVAALPAPPNEPPPLDETEAVAMAVAHLVVDAPDAHARPGRRLEVDDTHAILETFDGRAELSHLRIRTVTTPWRVVTACYEYEKEWRLTSLGAASGCAPAASNRPAL